MQAKFKFFNGNIKSNKDPRQIKRNKLTYLHYQNKMIEKYKISKFIFNEVSCFYPELFQRVCLDFRWLHSSFSIQWTPLQIILVRKQPLEILVKPWKISYKEVFLKNLTNLDASIRYLLKMNPIRGYSRTLSNFFIIHYSLFEFSEDLF